MIMHCENHNDKDLVKACYYNNSECRGIEIGNSLPAPTDGGAVSTRRDNRQRNRFR